MPLLNTLASDPVQTVDVSKVLEAASDLVEWAGELFAIIVANPVLVLFVGAGLVGVGLNIVSMLKNTAKG